jgi:hypothetical protein
MKLQNVFLNLSSGSSSALPAPTNVLQVTFSLSQKRRMQSASRLAKRDSGTDWEVIAYAAIELCALGGIALAAASVLSSY